MKKFKPILGRAIKRAGGEAAFDEMMPKPASARKLTSVSDDRYLSTMSLRVFSAGLKHSMVEAKWPAFEEAFLGFEPRRVASMPEDDVEALMKNKALIRHWPKISSVPANAAAMLDIAKEAGGFGAWVAAWPGTDIVGLWAEMGKRFKHLGGTSTPYFLRMIGKDTFVLTPDVAKGLMDAGVVDRKPSGKRDLAAVQEGFNQWTEETGLPLCQMSRALALSVG
jgi:3-methyladenine DNA glycosylase Tag